MTDTNTTSITERTDSQSQDTQLTSGLSWNHRRPFADDTAGHLPLPYLPSNGRCNPYVTSTVTNDVPYKALQQSEDPNLTGVAWLGTACGAISSAPSSSSSNSPPSSTAYSFAGRLSPIQSTIDGGENRTQHPVSVPFPPQRIEPLAATLTHGEGYTSWMPPGSSYWHDERGS